MAVESHISELSEKHKAIEEIIAKERSRPSIDNVKLTELKRQKLKLKDEINRLQDKVNIN